MDEKAKPPLARTGYRFDELPNNIRAIREAKGISNTELAAACGVTRGTVNKWETTNPPSEQAVRQHIADLLGERLEKVFPDGPGEGRARQMPCGRANNGPLSRQEIQNYLRRYPSDAPNNIRAIRGLRDMTQEDLAVLADTSITTIHHLEIGKIRLSEDWAYRISTALRCKSDDLFSE